MKCQIDEDILLGTDVKEGIVQYPKKGPACPCLIGEQDCIVVGRLT